VFEELGAANDDDGAWAIENVSITSFAGQTVYLLIEAADDSSESLVEAGIDNLVIVSTDLNHAPTADPQSVSTPEDTPLDILLTGSDPDGDPLTFTLVSSPTYGTLSGTAPNLTYTPAANYFGADSFTFLANDDQASSEPAAVSFDVTSVNDAPVANPQSVSTSEDMPIDIILTGSDPDGDPLTFTVVSSPTYGTLSGTAPNLIYTPAPGYIGLDSFSFVVNDDELDSVAVTVSITINQILYVPMIFK
jgi:hypothetical protein